MQNPTLLPHLATALAAALIGGLVALKLRQSVIVGYLLAGVAIGPFTPGITSDPRVVESLAEIGIVFLMFVVGVQLSLRELLRAGRVALLGGALQVALTIAAGYGLGRLLGWGHVESVFFGAVVSNSSSTVLTKVLTERHEGATDQARTALAWSSVQDLSTVIIVALLSSAATAEEGGGALGAAIGKTVLFLGVVVPLGLVAVPWILGRIADVRNREIFVLAAGAAAIGMAYVSGFLGVSAALGAFLAGAVVGESELAHRILGEAMPVRDVFAGLFFVSIGMMVDPSFLVRHPGLVLLALAAILVLKGTLSAVIARLLGSSWRAAIAIGGGLAQSGEFSLLMARLGRSLDALSAVVFNVMLLATALSILLAPQVARVAAPLGRWVARRREPIDDGAQRPSPENGDHAVVCGYGRVGRVVCSVFREHGIPFVVVDEEPAIVRDLRSKGERALLGDASRPEVLDRAEIERARVVVVSVPERAAVRRVVDRVRTVNPKVLLLVRTHSARERDHLYGQGAANVVMGELELALELSRQALRGFQIDDAAGAASIDRLRRSGG